MGLSALHEHSNMKLGITALAEHPGAEAFEEAQLVGLPFDDTANGDPDELLSAGQRQSQAQVKSSDLHLWKPRSSEIGLPYPEHTCQPLSNDQSLVQSNKRSTSELAPASFAWPLSPTQQDMVAAGAEWPSLLPASQGLPSGQPNSSYRPSRQPVSPRSTLRKQQHRHAAAQFSQPSIVGAQREQLGHEQFERKSRHTSTQALREAKPPLWPSLASSLHLPTGFVRATECQQPSLDPRARLDWTSQACIRPSRHIIGPKDQRALENPASPVRISDRPWPKQDQHRCMSAL